MIVELFYPKELKAIILDLRRRDGLNEVALKRVDRFLLHLKGSSLLLSILFFIVPIFFAPNFMTIITFWLIAGGIYLGVCFNVNSILMHMIDLYTYGEMTDGIVETFFKSYGIGGAVWGMSFVCEGIGPETKYVTPQLPNYLFEKRFSKGDKIQVLYDSKRKRTPLPFVENLNKIFNLTKEEKRE